MRKRITDCYANQASMACRNSKVYNIQGHFMDTLFSIITPTYNRAYILPKAIESLLAQTYKNWEMIIIDDGSTDNTKEVVGRFNDPRIKYFYQNNQKQCAARNKGLELAQGQWVCYLDSDNELFPNYLETMLAEIQADPNVVLLLPKGRHTKELYENGKLIKSVDDAENFPETLTLKDLADRKLHADMNGSMHHRKIISDGIRFDQAASPLEDWDLFLSIGQKYPDNFVYVTKELYHYVQRHGGDGLVANTGFRNLAKTYEYIFNKHKASSLLQGQTWYPRKVEEYNRLAEESENGSSVGLHEKTI